MTRTVTVPALAKINLDLRVLYRRSDQFHELRTVFHTISVADTLEVRYEASQTIEVSIRDNRIPENLIERAARKCLEAMGIGGRVEFVLSKRIPMGAGLGGGSSDAAAVLLALPALAGCAWPMIERMRVAAELGSDVPFFLLGGAAAGLGRGEELYPLPDRTGWGVLVTPGIHVSTPDAYRTLSGRLGPWEPKLAQFQAGVWSGLSTYGLAGNDFESVVFEQHPKIELIKSQLIRWGAQHALMSGSGSAVFGLFESREAARQARQNFGEEKTHLFSLVGRKRFRSAWLRRLAPDTPTSTWPPPSPYEQ